MASTTLPQNKPTAENPEKEEPVENLTIIGSTATSDFKPRLFRIDTPALPLFFSGTGDMFAALTVPRLIEAVHAASTPDMDLTTRPSRRSPDEVAPTNLPLAKASSKVLASMQAIRAKMAESCHERMSACDERIDRGGGGEQLEKNRHLALMNASEVVVPRHVRDLLNPPDLERFRPGAVKVDVGEVKRVGDELGVLHLGVGNPRDGAVQVEVDEREGSDKARSKGEVVGDASEATQEGEGR